MEWRGWHQPPFLSQLAERTIYVSPDGSTHPADGQVDTPVTLDTATNNATTGDTIIVTDGIYTNDSVTLGRDDLDDLTYQAADGARPIFVHSDGAPPAALVKSGVTVDGLWFGGVRPPTTENVKTITVQNPVNVHDCTFFNYISGVQNGENRNNNIYRRNRWVRCGDGMLSHPLYVSDSDDVTTEENIYVACEGYSIHYYHLPERGIVRWNFIGGALHGIAFNGFTHTSQYNIIWSVIDATMFYTAGGGSVMNQNVWGSRPSYQDDPAREMDGNYFIDPIDITINPSQLGTNPVQWNDTTDITTNLGDSSANINAAIAALDTAFQQTVAQIQADETIETHFATLHAVIDTWKAGTA